MSKNDLIKRLDEMPCPWPRAVWTMTEDEYVKAVPDERTRTAISGFLMREGWEAYHYQIKQLLEP